MNFPSLRGRPAEYASQWTQFKLTSPDVGQGLGSFLKRNRSYLSTVMAYFTPLNERQKDLPEVSPDTLSPQVVACGLWWCGQVYNNTRVINGSLVERSPTASFDLDMIYDSNGDSVSVQTNQTRSDVLRPVDPDGHLFPANDTFIVSQEAQIKLGRFFCNLFNITKSNGNEVYPVFPDADIGLHGIGDVMFKDRNISRTFQNIAASMTEQVRMSNSSFMVAGVAWDNETYVLVRWAWITLPLVVLCMSVVVLIATIRTNGGRKERLWKSSSLALLFHRVHGLQEDDVRVGSTMELDEISKNTNAQLRLNCNDKIEFVKTP